MAAVLGGLGAFIFLRFEAEIRAAVDAGLRSRAEVLLTSSHANGSIEVGDLIDRDESFAQLLAGDGQVLATSAGLAGGPLLPASSLAGVTGARFFDSEVATAEESISARLLAVPADGGTVLVVGASLNDQKEAVGRLLALLLIGGPVGILLASGVGWLVAGAALRPVERLRVEAEAISGSEPGRRLPVPDTRDELARLGDSLNRMLGRLEDAVERERRFVGDASHELRSPLANLKAELELARRRARTREELLAALHSAAEETDRLADLAEDLLVLARADGGRLTIRREELDADQLVRDSVGSFAVRASELGIALDTVIQDGVRAEADPARLRQALGNLIDNALQHTPRGGSVTVELGRLDGQLRIAVADSGAGFETAFLDRAFDPFTRSDAARSRDDGGAGLGLAIVRAVAEAHGGSVEASNRPEGGATVIISLPLQPVFS
jgi:heavy metal sensor kinase